MPCLPSDFSSRAGILFWRDVRELCFFCCMGDGGLLNINGHRHIYFSEVSSDNWCWSCFPFTFYVSVFPDFISLWRWRNKEKGILITPSFIIFIKTEGF